MIKHTIPKYYVLDYLSTFFQPLRLHNWNGMKQLTSNRIHIIPEPPWRSKMIYFTVLFTVTNFRFLKRWHRA